MYWAQSATLSVIVRDPSNIKIREVLITSERQEQET